MLLQEREVKVVKLVISKLGLLALEYDFFSYNIAYYLKESTNFVSRYQIRFALTVSFQVGSCIKDQAY